MGSVKAPTPAELIAVGKQLGLNLPADDVKLYLRTKAGNVAAYNLLETLSDHLPHVKYPRTRGHRPEPDENPYNAWYYRSEVKGAPDGKLRGKHVALKDNICLAGVPMMNGASALEGYVPDVDATIVTRILDAGGTIAGKVHCEYCCFSGGSHTSAAGPAHNPRINGVFGWRIVVGERGRGGGRRRADGNWRRPGRLHPHPCRVLRDLRHEADARPRPVHGNHAHRADPRPHRTHDRHRGRQCAPARGRRRARRPP